jgi:electron transport complex protein RnfG
MAAAELNGLPAAAFVTTVAAVAAALVTLSYEASRARIDANRRARLEAQLEEVLGDREYDNDIGESRRVVIAPELLGSRDPLPFYIASNGGRVVAVILAAVAPNGYNGPIGLLIGLDRDARITGVRVTNHRETPGLGDAIEIDRSNWIDAFTDTSLDDPPIVDWRLEKDGGRFDSITGATVTPRAVTAAIRNALVYFRDNRDSLLDTPFNEPTNDAQ